MVLSVTSYLFLKQELNVYFLAYKHKGCLHCSANSNGSCWTAHSHPCFWMLVRLRIHRALRRGLNQKICQSLDCVWPSEGKLCPALLRGQQKGKVRNPPFNSSLWGQNTLRLPCSRLESKLLLNYMSSCKDNG